MIIILLINSIRARAFSSGRWLVQIARRPVMIALFSMKFIAPPSRKTGAHRRWRPYGLPVCDAAHAPHPPGVDSGLAGKSANPTCQRPGMTLKEKLMTQYNQMAPCRLSWRHRRALWNDSGLHALVSSRRGGCPCPIRFKFRSSEIAMCSGDGNRCCNEPPHRGASHPWV